MFRIKIIIYSILGVLFSAYTILRIKLALKLKHNLFEIPLKKNKPFLILGTSDSLNLISKTKYNKFKEWNTIGLNYFLLNDFVPDIVQLELIAVMNGSIYLDNLGKIFNHRKDDFMNTIILIKSNYERSPSKLNKKIKFLKNLPEELKPNLRFTLDFPLPSLKLKEYYPSLLIFNKMGLLNKNGLKYIPHLRASLGLSTLIALRSKPNEIIYAGVDLNHRRTFYNPHELEKKYSVVLPKRELFCEKIKRHKMKDVHRTINKELSEITILDVISILGKHFSNHTKFSVIHEGSALREIMPLKKFN